jgi:hypothetical protein
VEFSTNANPVFAGGRTAGILKNPRRQQRFTRRDGLGVGIADARGRTIDVTIGLIARPFL